MYVRDSVVHADITRESPIDTDIARGVRAGIHAKFTLQIDRDPKDRVRFAQGQRTDGAPRDVRGYHTDITRDALDMRKESVRVCKTQPTPSLSLYLHAAYAAFWRMSYAY